MIIIAEITHLIYCSEMKSDGGKFFNTLAFKSP